MVWVYLRKETDYSNKAMQKAFQFVLKEASNQHSLRRVIVPVTKEETALGEFLEAVGFSKAGTQREAVYLHGAYHDVDFYVSSIGAQ